MVCIRVARSMGSRESIARLCGRGVTTIARESTHATLWLHIPIILPVFGRLVVQPGLGARHRLHQEEVCVEPQNP
jgi:hypothetical protein